jgi:hypothetical protein
MAHTPAGATPKQVRSAHPYHMHDHIHTQPDIIASVPIKRSREKYKELIFSQDFCGQ